MPVAVRGFRADFFSFFLNVYLLLGHCDHAARERAAPQCGTDLRGNVDRLVHLAIMRRQRSSVMDGRSSPDTFSLPTVELAPLYAWPAGLQAARKRASHASGRNGGDGAPRAGARGMAGGEVD